MRPSPAYPINVTKCPSSNSERVWYCIRGDRPTSPRTITTACLAPHASPVVAWFMLSRFVEIARITVHLHRHLLLFLYLFWYHIPRGYEKLGNPTLLSLILRATNPTTMVISILSTRPSSISLLILSLLFLCYSNGFSFHIQPMATKGTSTRLLSSLLAGTRKATTTTTTIPFMSAENDTATSRRITSFWKWRGHDIFTEVSTAATITNAPPGKNGVKKPSVILLHGFGASTTYWRETMVVLQNGGYDVHALDLLGQGRSSKPSLLRLRLLLFAKNACMLAYRLR